MKIINVVGARPNFMKIAPVMEAYKKSSVIKPLLLHTGQHYDEKMSDLFFKELKIQEPDIYLNIGGDTHAKQVARIMMKFEDVCLVEKPDAILVAGDVNSTMACALVASKMGIKIIHLEAGLRSYDRSMPEEVNRVVTDALADLLLLPSEDAFENLRKEGVSREKMEMVGNIMIDTLHHFLPMAQQSNILEQLALKAKQYILVTLHRPSNVDDYVMLKDILTTLQELSQRYKVLFPMHPRTRKNVGHHQLEYLLKGLVVTEPLGYLDFQKTMVNAGLVVTDSGGVQEETTALSIPCITLRENTERPITIIEGTNELIGRDMEKLVRYTDIAFQGNWKVGKVPQWWDGKTAERIVKAIETKL